VIKERKYFVCEGFRHIAHHCRNIKEEEPIQIPSNKFEVLKDRIIQRGEESGREVGKDKIILREERAKRGIEVWQMKVEKKKKKKRVLRKVTVKIGLK